MTGRHRRPDRSNRLALAGVGALGLVLGAPLPLAGVAAAAPAAGAWHTPEDLSDDDGDDLDRYREQRRDARERARERAEDEDRGASDRGASVRERTDDDRADRRSRDRDDRVRGRDGERAERNRGARHRSDRDRAAGESSSGSDVDDSGSASDSDQRDARWDRLAECESSQNWEADTGNGYKGGLQFSESTWREHGGREYAPSADQASREEQIEVAKEVQREQGWEAWPSCSEKLGYT